MEEDRLKPKATNRSRVDEAAATLIAFLPKLPEHGAEDTEPQQEATSNRLEKLQTLLKEHFTV
jgi:hypothetical protein